ncbi:MAG: hypothetical protein P8008_06725, partial [Gammaproteobacteria bacterium]
MTGRRNIGQEIIDSLDEIKRGEIGRVTEYPSIKEIRESTGLSKARFADFLDRGVIGDAADLAAFDLIEAVDDFLADVAS